MSKTYVSQVGAELNLEPDEPIMPNLFQQYQRVILETIITSFGLDMLLFDTSKQGSIADQHGGYVDTILGIGEGLPYKNSLYQEEYLKRGEYDNDLYHNGSLTFRKAKHEARESFRSTNSPIQDAYTGKEIWWLGNNKNAPPELNASIDHVLSAHTIHNDRRRTLSGLSGEELANTPDNYRFTNRSLNSSMGATKEINRDGVKSPVDIPRYIELHPELPEDTKVRMMEEYTAAEKRYIDKIERAYYSSPRFIQDTAKAAAKVGLAMGARQLCGFIFIELFFAAKEELDAIDSSDNFDMADTLCAVARGIERGLERVKEKYKEAFSKFGNGSLAGAMTAVTTTLINTFFTTSKCVVRIIKQSWAALTKAGEVLFINPDNYSMGDRLAAVAKIVATGACVAVGTLVSEKLDEIGVSAIPAVGKYIPDACGALVTGIMSCTLLYYFDYDPTVRKLVTSLNNIHTVEDDINYYKEQARYFEEYSAELMRIDIDKFKTELEIFDNAARRIEAARDAEDLNAVLKGVYARLDIVLPWQGDFDSFMQDKSKHLVFS